MIRKVERFDSFFAEVLCTCKNSVYLKVDGLEDITVKAFNCYARPGDKVLASVQKIYDNVIRVSIDSILYADAYAA